jgi:VWFA-related protein
MSRPRAIISLALVVVQIAVAASGAEHQQEAKSDRLRLSATLVQVPVVVTFRDGRFVTDVRESELAVFEDGKRKQIAMFAAMKQPFNAVLVLDTSNCAQARLKAIQETAIRFVREIRPEDRAMIIAFDNEVHQLTEFTSDQSELERAIKSVESGFGKLLYEAVASALEQLKAVEGRRAIILLSDGIDMRSIDASAESTIRMAEEVGAVIYPIQFDTRWWRQAQARKLQAERKRSKVPFDLDARIPLPPELGGDPPIPAEIPKPRSPRVESPPVMAPRGTGVGVAESADEVTATLDKLYGEAEAYMRALASSTGGSSFNAENLAQTRSAFAAIADELRNQYLIGYYTDTPRDGKYHRIKVEIARLGVQVRARPGYR